MFRALRGAAVLCVLAASFTAQAQRALVIAGSVSDDRMSLAVRSHFLPVQGVTLKLYRDDGDRLPNAADAAVTTTKTDAGGLYVFRIPSAGDYWVAVDSRTVRANAWPEQTFGPAGSLCAQPDGTSRATYFEGACFGGRTASGSDDATTLATSEHVALVTVREPATNVDFAFSLDAVTNAADGERVQGSLRQFFANANAVPGPNRMRFVPVETAPEQRDPTMGVPPRWWKITLATPLPELRDEDTVIDGTAYNYLSPLSIVNVHPGRFGEAPTLKTETRQIPRLEKPELEIVANGSTGILCTARCAGRSFALHGTAIGILTRADARFEHVIVGADAEGEPAFDGGTVGVQAERGTLAARHLLVTAQSRIGVFIASGARLDGERLDVSRCGEPLTGGGVILLSDGSSLRASMIATNPGAGIVLGAPDGTAPASGNSIDGNTISGNQAGVVISAGSSRNVITRNDVMWNRLGGVTVAPYESKPPRENRVSANRFDENGLRPIIFDLGVEDPNMLASGGDTCARTAAPNDGIRAPRITDVRLNSQDGLRVTVRGTACPGQIVELYQSFVTSGVKQQTEAEMPQVRGENIERETLTTQDRTLGLPSIGEFNYLGATNTAPDGSFEATFPIPLVTPLDRDEEMSEEEKEMDIWATQILQSASPQDRAFSGIAIDAAGNTSEMSVRRRAD